jgi:hypothetical protein
MSDQDASILRDPEPPLQGSIQGKVLVLLRHSAAIGLLWWSGQFLSNWYFVRIRSDYIGFAACLMGGLLLACGHRLPALIRTTALHRILLSALLLFLLLPWGEWLRLNFGASREDWSRQLYHQVLFLYGVIACLRLFPGLQERLVSPALRLLQRAAQMRFTFRLFPLCFFLFSAWIGVFLYGKAPLVQDTAAQIFQAKIFSAGRLTAPAPPVTEAFDYKGTFLAIYQGRWFCMYQPGLSLLLVPFLRLGIEWLMCPLMGAVTLAIWMDYIRRWHNAPLAVAFALLFLFSPFLLLMSSTIMIHTPELLIASALLYVCRRQVEAPMLYGTALLVVLGVLMMLVRGFSMIPFLGPVLVFTFYHLWKQRRLNAPVALACGIIAGAALLGAYQHETTGSFWIPPYRIVHPDYRYGFGPTLEGQVHTPARGLENTSNHILGLNGRLGGWYSGSVVFLIWLLLSKRKFARWDALLLLCCGCLAIFYFFFVIQDLAFGPRYFYVMSPILLLFIARTVDAQDPDHRLAAAVFVVSLLSFFPVGLLKSLDVYHPSNNQSRVLAGELRNVEQQKVVVFLDKSNLNFINWNDPFLQSNTVLCRDLKNKNYKILARFPGYQGMYFRPTSGGSYQEIRYRLSKEAQEPQAKSGSVSLFALAMTIQEAANYPDKDLFDIAYVSGFGATDCMSQLADLKAKETTLAFAHGYQLQFGLGLAHIGQMLLLPRCAVIQHGEGWAATLDFAEFRNQYSVAKRHMQDAGEVGKPMLRELDQAAGRMDRNRDGTMSDQEITDFFADKFR